MKVNIKMIRSVALESLSGVQEIFTRESSLMILDMDKEKCTGVTEVITKEVGKEASRMEKVIFRAIKEQYAYQERLSDQDYSKTMC